MTITQEEIFELIKKERSKQRKKYSRNDDAIKDHIDWYRKLAKFCDKYVYAKNKREYRKRLVQVAALAMAAIEALDGHYK